jgi:hypothetical protein
MLRDLREGGFASIEAGVVTIHDRARLCDLAQFDDHFLHLGGIDGPFSP